MTNEEAYKEIKDILKIAKSNDCCAVEIDAPKEEALTKAVFSLENEPCDDAISREAVLALSDFVGKRPTYSDPYGSMEEVVRVDDIEDLPSVYTSPKKGHWVEHAMGVVSCSECSYVSMLVDIESYNYCPNCGCQINPKPDVKPEPVNKTDRCMFCKMMFDLFCGKASRFVTQEEFYSRVGKPAWCPGREPSREYHD